MHCEVRAVVRTKWNIHLKFSELAKQKASLEHYLEALSKEAKAL